MIAGIGFARMAWKLAQKRTFSYVGWEGGGEFLPLERQWMFSCPNSPTAEYYRIIDNAWAHFDTMRQCNALFGDTVHL
jgi:hypothetical protein